MNQLLRYNDTVLTHEQQTLKDAGVVEGAAMNLTFKAKRNIVATTFNDNFYNQGLEHTFPQTLAALRRLRSNLLVTTYHLPAEIQSKFLSLIRHFSRGNAPLVTSLKTLFNKKNLCETQKIALEEGLFYLFRDFLMRCKDFPKHFLAQDVFLATRECLGFFLDAAKNLKDSEEFQESEYYQQFDSVCSLTSERIR